MLTRQVFIAVPGLVLVLVLALGACDPNTGSASADTNEAGAAPAEDQSPIEPMADAGQTPASGPRPSQTLASAQDRVAAMFERVDADGNGVITAVELEASAVEGGRGGRMLARADADGDGDVTRDEAVAQAVARFQRMDADGDGTISEDERPRRRGGQVADPA